MSLVNKKIRWRGMTDEPTETPPNTGIVLDKVSMGDCPDQYLVIDDNGNIWMVDPNNITDIYRGDWSKQAGELFSENII